MATPAKDGTELIVKNRRAPYDYELEQLFEGGLVLMGSEVKSLRAGKVDITDSFATVEHGECWLKQLFIHPYDMARAFGHEPRRARKVLLHRREIAEIEKGITRGGYTVIPVRLYFKEGRVKIEIALARGKKKIDKRQDIAQKEAAREARAAIGRRRKEEG